MLRHKRSICVRLFVQFSDIQYLVCHPLASKRACIRRGIPSIRDSKRESGKASQALCNVCSSSLRASSVSLVFFMTSGNITAMSSLSAFHTCSIKFMSGEYGTQFCTAILLLDSCSAGMT